MRLRQFVFVAERLAPVVDALVDVLDLAVCFRDPGVGKFGLENALLPIGGNLLEVVAPIEPGTTAGRHLERRGGDGGYMVIVQCADALAERERIVALGVRDVWRHDGDGYCATHFHPRDVPGAILSIDTMHPGSDYHRELSHWQWAGPDWQHYVRTGRTQALTAVEIQADDPAPVAERWARVLDRPVETRDGVHAVALDNARLRFVEAADGRGPGVSAIDVLPQDRDAIRRAAEHRGLARGPHQIELGGVRVNLL